MCIDTFSDRHITYFFRTVIHFFICDVRGEFGLINVQFCSSVKVGIFFLSGEE